MKSLLQPANFTLGPDATHNTEIHKKSVHIKAPNSVNASKQNIKIKLITMINKDEYSWLILLCASVNENTIVEPRRAKLKTNRQAPIHWLKFYEEAIVEFPRLTKSTRNAGTNSKYRNDQTIMKLETKYNPYGK